MTNEPNKPETPNQPEPELSLPQQTSDRDYNEPEKVLDDLTPGSPREKGMVEAFKHTIAQHLSDVEDKTTKEFLDELALDLWRRTRIPYQ